MTGMLGKFSPARHAFVVAAIGGTTLLAATGVIGGGDHPERFDQWQSVVEPAGTNGVRITDTFDQDFGTNDRRGHETYIAHDAGVPTDITASSPDAPDDLGVADLGTETRVRIGDPDVTISGQHRYTLAYTLPQAMVEGGVLSLDVLDPDQLEIDRYELIVTGWVLDDPVCLVGGFGSSVECDLVDSSDGTYRWLVEPVASGEGITVEGDIVDVVEPETIAAPPLPDRRSSNQGLLALAVAALGVVGGGGVFAWARRKGRNEVFAGGAADAAYGTLPPPGATAPGGGAATAVELVADDQMSDLATIEFVPPKGIAPWQASVLHHRTGRRRCGRGLALRARRFEGAVEIAESDANLVDRLRSRARVARRGRRAPAPQLPRRRRPATRRASTTPRFATAWASVQPWQAQRIATVGWWKHLSPGGGVRPKISGSPFGLIMAVVFFFVWTGSILTAFLGLFSTVPIGPPRRSRSSRRCRLLHVSRAAPGPQRGGFGARPANRVVPSLPPRQRGAPRRMGVGAGTPARVLRLGGRARRGRRLVGGARARQRPGSRPDRQPGRSSSHRRGPSMRSARTAPSSSGSGGGGRSGGGFRGGSVGGGGGGRSRGSW